MILAYAVHVNIIKSGQVRKNPGLCIITEPGEIIL